MCTQCTNADTLLSYRNFRRFDEVFEAPLSDSQMRELMPGGGSCAVTFANRGDFVSKVRVHSFRIDQ